MEDDLKGYRKSLEKAIYEALTDSPQINSIILKIQESGYEVFLIVEATVGFNKPEDEKESSDEKDPSKVRLQLTSQDERFLRQLKISPD